MKQKVKGQSNLTPKAALIKKIQEALNSVVVPDSLAGKIKGEYYKLGARDVIVAVDKAIR